MDEDQIHSLLEDHGHVVATSKDASRSHLVTHSSYAVAGLGAMALCGKTPTYNWKQIKYPMCDVCLAMALRRGYLIREERNEQ